MSIMTLEEKWKEYLRCADVSYAYEVALKLHPIVNSPLGGRNAGSRAEHEAAELLLAEMKKIGLQDVRKEAFPVVKWQFNGARLSARGKKDNRIKDFQVYAYPSGATLPEGVQAPLVIAGRGTRHDLERLNIRGKIILIEVNMRDDWWVTYPVLEAAHRGALAVICSSQGGFAMGSDEALNCQDFVGPHTIPTVSISRKEAAVLKEMAAEDMVTVSLMVDGELNPHGTSCNLIGSIPGKYPGEQLLIGDHYDCHFWGFQDNNTAVGLTLAIARGILDAGIQPDRTLRFILHGAEESGALDTRYDWSVGAWNQINRICPEWAGETLAYLNFELPAFEFGETHYTAAAPELFGLLDTFRQKLPENLITFRGDPYETGFSQSSWSDDWSYSAAGVPGMVNGFLLNKKGEVNPFFKTHYHSQLDNPDTYDEGMLDHNLKLYGLLTLFMDEQILWPLDFSALADRLEKSLMTLNLEQLMDDQTDYRREVKTLRRLGIQWYRLLSHCNACLMKHGSAHNDRLMFQSVNRHMLQVYKRCQDHFLRLDWSDIPITGHEHYQHNSQMLEKAIDALGYHHIEEALQWLGNIEDETISLHFSKSVVDHFTRQVMDVDRKKNQYWGTGRMMGALDLYEVITALQSKMSQKVPDTAVEVRTLERVLQEQTDQLQRCLRDEIKGMREVAGMLQDADFLSQMAILQEIFPSEDINEKQGQSGWNSRPAPQKNDRMRE